MTTSLQQYKDLLSRYLRPQWVRVALLAIVLLGTTGLQLANPQIVRFFIDSAMAGGALESLVGAALIFLTIALLTQLLQVAATYLGENVGWTATNNLRVDLTLHCLRLDLAFHKTRTPGEMIERIDGDIDAMSRFFSQFVIQVIGNLLLLIGVLVALFVEDWRIGLALTLFTLAALWVLSRLREMAVPAMIDQRQATAEVFGFLEERLSGLQDIRANGAGDHVMRGLHRVMAGAYWAGRKAWKMDGRMWGITLGMFSLGYVLAFAVGAYLFASGSITLGTVYLIFQYTDMLRRPLDVITEQLKEFQKASAGIGRVRELLGTQPDITDGVGINFQKGPLSVEFDRVSFGYGDEEMVLHDLSFRLEPGRVLGLLGRTGSGKTTVTRLLFRLYDPASGAIRLEGQDIREATLEQLRHSVGMVTQDVQLFGASVRENLTLFDSSIPDQRILDTLYDLGLGRWVKSLPDGLDTQLGPGGGGLSAGEAQLIAFARVFLRDPGLVILDEASSRLDPATEQLIERAVEKLLRGRTGIIIAHRLHTVGRADEILILDEGRIIEQGNRVRLTRDDDSRFSHLLKAGMEEMLV
jgi:ABC-type multidrug transport system fused ATPase/permease subunit